MEVRKVSPVVRALAVLVFLAAGLWLVGADGPPSPVVAAPDMRDLPAAGVAPPGPVITVAQAAAIPGALSIVHTNDTWGYIEPCG